MSKKNKLTVKEINEYADSCTDKTNINFQVCDFVDQFDFMRKCHIFDENFYVSDYPEYVINFAFSEENGHVLAYVYDAEKYKAWQIATYEHWKKIENLPLDVPLEEEAPDIKEEFVFEVPLTRGFSDIPGRRAVEVNDYVDMECAVEEYLHEKDGTQKIHPWMLKQIAGSDDFGLEEEEFDTLLEVCCALA